MIQRASFATQLCALTLLVAALPVMGSPVSLMDLRWQHRLILVFTASGSPEFEDLVQWVADNKCNLEERETLVFTVERRQAIAMNDDSVQLDDVSVAALTQQRKASEHGLEMLLVGKDGGIKERASSISELDSFVASIDSMPMRKSEAAENQNNC